jgi:hypothetical protein
MAPENGSRTLTQFKTLVTDNNNFFSGKDGSQIRDIGEGIAKRTWNERAIHIKVLINANINDDGCIWQTDQA